MKRHPQSKSAPPLAALPAPDYATPDGSAVLYCGDCLDILPKLPAGSVDAVVTDPPYRIKHVDGGGFAQACAFYRDGQLDGLTQFDLSDYMATLTAVANQIVAFHSRDQINEYAAWMLGAFGNFDLHVWRKVDAVPFTNNVWKSDVEYIALGWRGTKNHCRVPQHIKSKVYKSAVHKGPFHPTEKPVELMAKYVSVIVRPGGTVCDPFAGSGTTGVACLRLGRRFIGIERERKYFDIAVRRLAAEAAQGKLSLAVETPYKAGTEACPTLFAEP